MKNPTARSLALRDRALAALVGADSFRGSNSDFGGDWDEDDDDDDIGYDAEFGDDFADDDDVGYDAEFGGGARPTKRAALTAWQRRQRSKSRTGRRVRMLEPNKNSAVKVERYSFSLSQDIVLGTASAVDMAGQPDTTIRPQRLTVNAPSPGFVFLSEIKVANVSVSIGGGVEDAFNYNPTGVDMTLDMPTLTPANRASLRGTYSGFVPPGYVGAAAYTLSASFKGPASIVA